MRAYRKVNQLSQVSLAEQLGYDPAYISLPEGPTLRLENNAETRHMG